MRSHLHRSLVLVLALVVGGAHWAMLQGVAWTGMLVARSVRADVATAVRSTFDGKHPCSMCMSIKKARTEETAQSKERSAQPRDDVRWVGLLAPAWITALPGHDRLSYPSLAAFAPSTLRERPPVPPPR